ncbi:hypothetical protein, partial [Pseudomonas aeruginosa]
MPGHRITLTGEKQTLLITLYAKAADRPGIEPAVAVAEVA